MVNGIEVPVNVMLLLLENQIHEIEGTIVHVSFL